MQNTFRRPLLPESKRPFAPSPKHFWEFSLFGQFPRPAASPPLMFLFVCGEVAFDSRFLEHTLSCGLRMIQTLALSRLALIALSDWRVPNPPGANPLVAEGPPWSSSQSRVTAGHQPSGNPYRFLPGRNCIIYAPPPPPRPLFLAKSHFSGEGGGGAYFEAPRGRNCIRPSPPRRVYFQGWGGRGV